MWYTFSGFYVSEKHLFKEEIMLKKILLVFLAMLVVLCVFSGKREPDKAVEEPAEEEVAPKITVEEKPVIKNPDTFIYVTHGTIDSLDSAKTYDSASWTVMATIYETLVDYDGTATDKFNPIIASELPTLENGGISPDGMTYRFKIRKGVKFHSGRTLTPEDVEYSLERNLVVDVDGGPGWIWFFLFLGNYSSRDGDGNIVVDYKDIDKAIEVDGDYVVFNLAAPFPPFLGVLAGRWASIVSKDFVIENGGWDGTEATWKQFNNPPEGEETLYDIADGTGPYKLSRWEKGVEFVVEQHDMYWGPKPALRRGIYKVVEEWSTRKLMLLQGDADCIEVPAVHFPEMDKEQDLQIYTKLPSLTIHGINFNQKVSAKDNPAVYSGSLDGEGISADFFSDKNVRLGFIHAWDEETFLRDALSGEGMDPVTPVPFGLPFKNKNLKGYPHDMAKAEEYLKKAWGGQVWEKGFKVDFLYNSGNSVREVGMKMLAENLMKLNPKFQITVRAVEWAVYVDMNRNRQMPIFFIGWAPDYPDPDNYVFPYQHSEGTYAGRAGYKNEEVDRLIGEGAVELDPAKREKIYYRLQELWLEDAVGIMTHQPLRRRYYKNWVKGEFFNPMQSHEFDILASFDKK
jgi:peptide/nickel transport system substrate-binding protein